VKERGGRVRAQFVASVERPRKHQEHVSAGKKSDPDPRSPRRKGTPVEDPIGSRLATASALPPKKRRDVGDSGGGRRKGVLVQGNFLNSPMCQEGDRLGPNPKLKRKAISEPV